MAAPRLELEPMRDGNDPREGELSSVPFRDASGQPIIEFLVMRQFFIDVYGDPLRTTDGRLVHGKFDARGQPVYGEDGHLILVVIDVPTGAVNAPSRAP